MTHPPHNWPRPLLPATDTARPPVAHPPAFTILELLMVISVLSVVLAIIMPSIQTIRNTAQRRQAAAEATALAQAAIRYKTEYGFWPGQVQPNNDDAQGTVKLNERIPDSVRNQGQALACIAYGGTEFLNKLTVRYNDGTTSADGILKLFADADINNGRLLYQAFSVIGRASAPPYPVNPLNPKGIHFLDLKNEHDYLTVDYRDPWNQDYVLLMGLNPEHLFTYEVTGGNGTTIRQSISNQIAFAFSVGPPHQRGTNLIYSAGVSP